MASIARMTMLTANRTFIVGVISEDYRESVKELLVL